MKKIICACVTLIALISFSTIGQQAPLNTSETGTIENSESKANGGCGLFIEEVHVFGGGHINFMYPHFQNITGNSLTNYADYTSTCIPNCNQPALSINLSLANYYLAIYLDNDNNGTFETLAFSEFVSTHIKTIPQLSVAVNQSAGLRIIVSDQVISNSTAIPSCGEMEDYVFCESCLPPQNTNCLPHNKFDYQTLSWDPIQNATSYEITLAYNDPLCCSQAQQGIYISTLTSLGTHINVSTNSGCFSWSVVAIFANGDESPSSSFECSCEILSPAGDPVPTPTGGSNSRQSLNGELNNGQLRLSILPNPANNYVQITLSSNFEVSLNGAEVIIHTTSGKIIYRSTISLDEEKTVDLSSFTPGIYIINIVDENTILSSEKLIIQ